MAINRELKASCNEANGTEKLLLSRMKYNLSVKTVRKNWSTDLLIFGVSIFASSIGFHMTSSKFKLKNYISIWLSVCFHKVLEHLKYRIYSNFHFENALCFVIQCAWISKLLLGAAFTWRPRELSCRLKKWLILGEFDLCAPIVSENRRFSLMFMSSLRDEFMLS